MIDFALPEAPLDVDAALALLRRTLRRNAGHFAFVVVVVDEHTRGEVMRRLREWSGADGVPTLTEFPTGADGAGKLDLLLRGGLPRHGGIVVPDGDALVVADEGRLAAGLNLARDQLRKWVAGPFVVLLSSPALAALARAVPDLYDVRHMVEVRNQDAVVPTFGALQANDRESMFTLRDLENNLACFCGAPILRAQPEEAVARFPGLVPSRRTKSAGAKGEAEGEETNEKPEGDAPDTE